MQNYYCNQKFWWLSIDLEKFQTFSCCAATPQSVDFAWLADRPGQIFNTPTLHHERKMMLANEPVASCEAACWQPESQNQPSRRTVMQGQVLTHTSIESVPRILNLIVGTDCTMTCVYCCKFYSKAWTRDIVQNGTYTVDRADDRFTVNNVDRILATIGQKDIVTSSKRRQLIDQVLALCHESPIEKIMITGGEPLLYLGLTNLITSIPEHIPVKVFSGFGVDEKRFERKIGKFSHNVTAVISVESIGSLYEFVRFGNSWDRFSRNLESLQRSSITYEFNSTVTNLTMFGLKQFIEWAQGTPINFQPCTDPDFLSIHVIDDDSKQHLKSQSGLPDFVYPALELQPTGMQIQSFRSYAKEFARRRSLDLSVFPRSFECWMQ